MRGVVVGALLSVSLGVSGALASDASTGAAALLSASCSGCHTGGDVDTSIPKLDGYSADQIRDLLTGFQTDDDVTLMNRIARGYTAEEIGIIAEYLGTKAE